MIQGIVFGSFDRLHPGHQWFLEKAQTHCTVLTVVVARDEDIAFRKGRKPIQRLTERMRCVKEFCPMCTVVPGDQQFGQWSMLEDADCAIVGYDQTELRDALEKLIENTNYRFKIIVIESYHPERYKSSFYVRS